MAHVAELAVNRKKWLDSDTFRNGLALSQRLFRKTDPAVSRGCRWADGKVKISITGENWSGMKRGPLFLGSSTKKPAILKSTSR
ncbi:hypothetical protein [Syntrophus gentianae]|uniref:hypothetical protein n=1 Tax=Syntrophus gentianae TaxID=43775 RepID=UPI003B28D57C